MYEVIAQSWIGDDYCDDEDSPWDYELFCPAFNNDGGDCCPAGQAYDCDQICVDESKLWPWVGDGYCDDQSRPYGVNLKCAEFNDDGGDCS